MERATFLNFVKSNRKSNSIKSSFLEYYGMISAIKNHTKTTGALTSNKDLLHRLKRTPSKSVRLLKKTQSPQKSN